MNYRVVIEEKMGEFKKSFPEYSFTQTILSALKQTEGFATFTKGDLLSITDEDFYSAIEVAYRKESDKSEKYKD
jgi:hypothetical protein